MESERAERIRPALGKISSGIYVLTGTLEGEPLGMLASFIEQAGFTPPMISVAMGNDRPMRKVFESTGQFGLHVLSNENKQLMRSFSGKGDPFAAHEVDQSLEAIPQLREALAFLSCRVAGSLPAGDHTLYLAEVLDGWINPQKQEPMVRVRANGFSY